MICPCCHQEVPEDELQRAALARVTSGAVGQRILDRLQRASRPVPLSELVEHVYALDPTGGPLNADLCIRTTIHRMQPRLAGIGLTIKGRGGYKLERLNG